MKVIDREADSDPMDMGRTAGFGHHDPPTARHLNYLKITLNPCVVPNIPNKRHPATGSNYVDNRMNEIMLADDSGSCKAIYLPTAGL